MKKAIVIGSGISGLSIAKMLSDKYDVEVLEKSDKAGGLIKCDRIGGNLFHKVGGHVFNSKDEIVLNWFWQHFDRDNEFLKASRNAKIFLKDKLIGYPLENYLYELPEDETRAIVEELIGMLANNIQSNSSTYDNFKDFLIGNFGENLYRLYFGPYNSKIWNTDIGKVPLEWLDGKLPMPKIKEVIISNIIKKEETNMVHASFFYPKRDGSQFIVNRLSEGLNINLSYNVSNITYDNAELSLNNGEIISDVLIFCGDVRKLHTIIKIDDEDLSIAMGNVENLKSNGTSNVLCETDDNNISWLYLPEEKFKAHRIIYTGNFSNTNNEGTDRKTCVVEFSGKQDKNTMMEELNKLPGNLKPLAFNYEPNSYIIQDKGTREKIAELKRNLEKYNIYLLGRFAEWEYYNMDKAIEAAMDLSKTLL